MARNVLTGEPYLLSGHRLAFTSWFWVRPGKFTWVDGQGKVVNVVGDQDALGARFVRPEDPMGVRIVFHAPSSRRQVIGAAEPWDQAGPGITTVLKDGGVYRAWGYAGWGSSLPGRAVDYMTYYESDNGLDWRRPRFDIIPFEGISQTNLICPKAGSVFIDPSAAPAERYKWVREDAIPAEAAEEYLKRHGQDVQPAARAGNGSFFCAVGAVSPDGIAWELLKNPLVLQIVDTQNVCYYDRALGKYVMYTREWISQPQGAEVPGVKHKGLTRASRRAIGRVESADFRHFPLSDVVLEPSLDMLPSQTLYTNCRTTIPGAPEAHVMFPTVWDQADDITSWRMAVSSDGRVWNWVPGGDFFGPSEFGQWDGGCVFAAPELIELPNGDFALPYTGFNVPHKYPRQKASRGVGCAIWPKGRLVGIEARERGAFSTLAVIPPGRRLRINADTHRSGHITVEAARYDETAIAGREFANSVPLVGDCLNAPVRWREHEDLGADKGQPLILRFRMERAKIYSVDFV